MLRPVKKHYTVDEYLAMEEVAEYKSEYYNGKIYAMSGGSGDHSLIQGNLITRLNERLRATPCRVFTSDMRLLVEQSTFYTYPDATVVCGKVQFAPERNDVLLNPTVVIEVLSPSTRNYDRTQKFSFYKKVPSVQDYVLVESTRAHVECLHRAGRQWVLEMYNGPDARLKIESLNIEIPLSELYEKVSWME